MKLSTKTRYGLRAMLYMAERYDGERALPVGEIAREQGVSEKYLEHLFTLLRRFGLINSIRGAQGGYLLGRPPEEITAASVVEVLEGGIVFADCSGSGECDNRNTCPTHDLWERLKGSVDEILEDTTLRDLLGPKSSAIAAEAVRKE